MPISITCQGCSARLNAPDSAQGKTLKCPKCKSAIKVPSAEPEENQFEFNGEESAPVKKKKRLPDDEDGERPRANKRQRGHDEDEEEERPRASKQRRGDDEDEDEEEERPRKKTGNRRKPQKSGNSLVLIIVGSVMALMLIGGIAFGVYWFALSEKPKESSAGGAGSNTSGNSTGGGKAAVPAGWQQASPPQSGFKAYFPTIEENLTWAPAKPQPGSKDPVIANYFSWSTDHRTQTMVLLYIYPNAVPADVEKTIVARLNVGTKPEFVKEISRGTATLGSREAKEIVEEVDFAGVMGGKAGPGGQKLPDKLVAVTRYAIAENRVVVASIVNCDSRAPAAEERGFFDNFEFVPISETTQPNSPSTPIKPKQSDGFRPPDAGGQKVTYTPDQFPPTQPGPRRQSPYTAAGKFQIWFPFDSIHNKAKNDIMRSRKLFGSFADCYDVEKGLSYHLAFCDYPSSSSPDAAKKLYDEIVNSLTGEGFGSEVISRGKATMAGKEWEEIIARNGTSQTVTRSLNTTKGVLAFSITSKTGLLSADVQKAFFSSFKFEE